MKQKVAWIATLLNFVACLLFLLIVATVARDSLNDIALDDMNRVCRLSASVADSAAFAQEGLSDLLRGAAMQTNTVFTLYADDGTVAFVSRPAAQDTLSAEERAQIINQSSHTFIREHGALHGVWLYAGTALKDGGILLVSEGAYGMGSVFGTKLFLMGLLAVIVPLLCLVLFLYANRRSAHLLNSVLSVLTDFSEGQFDSRISNRGGDSIEQVARFNEVIGRVQDRVFKQRTRNEALSTIMNYMKTGILAVDDQLNVILVNAPAKQLLGITGNCEGEPIQQASRDVKLDQVFLEAMRQEGVYTNEVAARTAVGRGHRPIRLYVSPMMKDGRAVGCVAIVEDITELRRLEEVRVDFAANVSHELKTPLTTIKGFVETLENGAIDNPEMAHKFLNIIMLEADRLTRLINDILSISKMESGTDAVPNEKIRIDKSAGDVCEMLRIHAREREVTINMHGSGEGSYVMGNPDRVRQMLINLVENAIKYNKQGGAVNVSVFNADTTVNVTVSDTGIGIAEENLPRLFERFYRVDKGRSRSMGGTGLGLAIVKHIVKSMNGLMEVHSKLGEGTEFLITLPRVEPPEEQPKQDADDDEFA